MGFSVKKKLFYQTLAFILPILIASIFFTSVILSLSTDRFFQKTIAADYSNIIKTAADSISLFHENARTNLETLAQMLSSLKLDPWEKEIALAVFIQQNPQFSAIDLISPQGAVIAETVSITSFQNESFADLLDQALSGRTAVSKVMKNKKELPYVAFAVPVFHLGHVAEIVRARLSLKFVWDILENIRVGEKGQVYVMDGSGRIIAHREIHRVLQPSGAGPLEILAAIREKAGPVEWVDADDGASYNLGIYIPSLDWIVALIQPREEVYGYLYQNGYWAALISLLVAIGAIFWGWLGSRRLLAPIHALHRQVVRIGQGELNQKISIDRADEIGDLGRAFNEMTDSLKKYVNQEVETARTLAHNKNLAILGTVASKISHELGNSLVGVQMMLSGLKEEPLSQSGRETLRIIENEMEQNSSFIKGFLRIARKPDLNFSRCSLDGLIRDVLERIRPEADGRGIVVTLNWEDSIPRIPMDAGLMNQVFTNLVKNSVEAMSGPGSLIISGKAVEEYLVVSITDTGCGMDPETRERIFEPFFSTKGARGNGLGLAIVKSNIEAHGGTIECMSNSGKGTEFLIRFTLGQQI